MQVSLAAYYRAYDEVAREEARQRVEGGRRRTALANYLAAGVQVRRTGFQRIELCRRALDALDRRGWQRSFHQRMFHDNFIRACARIFWKCEPPGAFARDHKRILELNGWDHLSQEVLISTPRRSVHERPKIGAGAVRGTLPKGPKVARLQRTNGARGHGGRHGVPERVQRQHAPPVPRARRSLTLAPFFGAGSARPSRSACSPRRCCTAARASRCPYTARAR